MKFYCYMLCGMLCLGPAHAMAQSITEHQINLPGSFSRDLLQMARDDEGLSG